MNFLKHTQIKRWSFYTLGLFCALFAGSFLSGADQTLLPVIQDILSVLPISVWMLASASGSLLWLLAASSTLLPHRDQALWCLLCIGVLCAAFTKATKFMINAERPPFSMREEILPTVLQATSYAFPSGHTTTAFFIACFLHKLLAPHPLRYFFILWATFVALSRLALGVHWLADVIVGSIIGWFFAQIALLLLKQNRCISIFQQNTLFLLCYVSSLSLLIVDLGYGIEYNWNQQIVGVVGCLLSLSYIIQVIQQTQHHRKIQRY